MVRHGNSLPVEYWGAMGLDAGHLRTVHEWDHPISRARAGATTASRFHCSGPLFRQGSFVVPKQPETAQISREHLSVPEWMALLDQA